MHDPKLGLEKTPSGYKDEGQEDGQIWLNQISEFWENSDFSETVKLRTFYIRYKITKKTCINLDTVFSSEVKWRAVVKKEVSTCHKQVDKQWSIWTMKRKLQCDLFLKRTFTIEYKFVKIVSCTNDLALFFALSLSYVRGEENTIENWHSVLIGIVYPSF